MADNETSRADKENDSIISEDLKLGLCPAAILAILTNYTFYFYNSSQVSKLQYVLCFYLPGRCGIAMAITMLLIRAYLAGNIADQSWQLEQAKEVMKHSDKFHKRLLAGLVVLFYKPMFFLAYWTIFSGAFLGIYKVILEK